MLPPSSPVGAPAEAGTGNEPGQRVGYLDACEVVVAVGVAREHAEVVAHVGDVRERPAGVERQRRQHREDLLLVVVLERGPLPGIQAVVVDDVDAGRVELGPQVAEALAGRLHDAPGALLRDGQQLLRRVAVRGRLGHAGLDLLPQAGDAHHEELAEDRPDDADELDPLEQRVVRVASLVEHALEEVEHAQLAVDVERRIAKVGVRRLRRQGGVGGELLLRRPGALLHGLAAVILVGARALLWPPHVRTSSARSAALTLRSFSSGSDSICPDCERALSDAPSAETAAAGGCYLFRSPPAATRARRALRSPCSRPARRRAPRS